MYLQNFKLKLLDDLADHKRIVLTTLLPYPGIGQSYGKANTSWSESLSYSIVFVYFFNSYNTFRVSLDIINLFTPHLGINPFAPFIFTSTFVNNFSIKVNRHHVLRSWFFPWISKPEPIVGFFNLKWFIISLRDKNAIKQIT